MNRLFGSMTSQMTELFRFHKSARVRNSPRWLGVWKHRPGKKRRSRLSMRNSTR